MLLVLAISAVYGVAAPPSTAMNNSAVVYACAESGLLDKWILNQTKDGFLLVARSDGSPTLCATLEGVAPDAGGEVAVRLRQVK